MRRESRSSQSGRQKMKKDDVSAFIALSLRETVFTYIHVHTHRD